MIVKTGPACFYTLLALLVLASCAAGTGTDNCCNPPQASPVVSVPPQAPQPQGFSLWLADFRREALARGISQPVLDNAFAGITGPSQTVLERDQSQPEQKKSFEDYLKAFLKQRKLDAAHDQWESHTDILSQVQEAYGVPAPILLALWQTESNFGAVQGKFSITQSLSTLAYDGRRSAFFRTELLDALVLLQQEHMNAANLVGSWAGAMGQVQFMPSSFLSFAVDFDGDGKKDIWNDDADALASMANYLHTRGWDQSMGWGLRVRVPRGADAESWAQDKEWHGFSQWKKRGLRKAGGGKLPKADYETRLVMPDNDPDYAYLVTANYDVLMDWNHSTYFATGVGLLADAIAAGE